MENNNDTPDKTGQNMQIAKVFFVFAILCFITGFILSFNTGVKESATVSEDGALIGPFTIEEDNTVLQMEVNRSIQGETWSFITLELLDEDQNYLMGFGDELYYETGYDSDGRWTASKQSYDQKFTIPEKGEFYLRAVTENGSQIPSEYGDIKVTIKEQIASSIPQVIAGIVGLLISIFFWYRAVKDQIEFEVE